MKYASLAAQVRWWWWWWWRCAASSLASLRHAPRAASAWRCVCVDAGMGRTKRFPSCCPVLTLLPWPPALQLRRLKLVLANGTMLELSPKSNPHLFMAAGVSVGRLGIVTEVTLKIKPQQAVQRRLQARKMQLELGPSPWLSVGSVAGDKPPSASDACPPLPRYPLVQELSFQDFAAQVLETQEAYNAAKQANDVDGMRRALFQASLPASAASSAGWLAVGWWLGG